MGSTFDFCLLTKSTRAPDGPDWFHETSTERFDVPLFGSCCRPDAWQHSRASERIRTARAASGIGGCG
jgi:hypothetical protein